VLALSHFVGESNIASTLLTIFDIGLGDLGSWGIRSRLRARRRALQHSFDSPLQKIEKSSHIRERRPRIVVSSREDWLGSGENRVRFYQSKPLDVFAAAVYSTATAIC
jgi:hypothetical protein